jgi:hypothetical protein
VSDTHRKNIQKKRLSRGKRGRIGPCPYFFGISLSVFIENQQYSKQYQKSMSLLFVKQKAAPSSFGAAFRGFFWQHFLRQAQEHP